MMSPSPTCHFGLKEPLMNNKWTWLVKPRLTETDHLGKHKILSECPRVYDPYHQFTAVFIGETDSDKYVWWAITESNSGCMIMYTGSGIHNYWSGSGDPDFRNTADNAELCLRRMAFVQERE